MNPRVLWSGLAVVDAKGKAVIWRGSDTPKLYRSEEQGVHARTDGAELVPVTLMLGHVMPSAEKVASVVAAVRRAVGGRVYRAKVCAYRGCREVFTPSGPRSLYCARHTTARHQAVAS